MLWAQGWIEELIRRKKTADAIEIISDKRTARRLFALAARLTAQIPYPIC
ncbi:MAG: hypothetical protein IPL59_13225 [Candidatus Competibacteraceae bacterium]|nr:hypothetical protein [Candidatus Competibacteraceae bacterium]MBK8750455.1 hypothetical protein [Candidatus Competibacteraceae bacterium]